MLRCSCRQRSETAVEENGFFSRNTERLRHLSSLKRIVVRCASNSHFSVTKPCKCTLSFGIGLHVCIASTCLRNCLSMSCPFAAGCSRILALSNVADLLRLRCILYSLCLLTLRKHPVGRPPSSVSAGFCHFLFAEAPRSASFESRKIVQLRQKVNEFRL